MEKYSSRPTARRKDRIKDALAMMIASSGSRTVHKSPIGRVNVGSVKEISIKEKMRMIEMAVTLREVYILATHSDGTWHRIQARARTYNTPIPKIPTRPKRCDIGICNFQMLGIGKSITIRSVPTFKDPAMM